MVVSIEDDTIFSGLREDFPNLSYILRRSAPITQGDNPGGLAHSNEEEYSIGDSHGRSWGRLGRGPYGWEWETPPNVVFNLVDFCWDGCGVIGNVTVDSDIRD